MEAVVYYNKDYGILVQPKIISVDDLSLVATIRYDGNNHGRCVECIFDEFNGHGIIENSPLTYHPKWGDQRLLRSMASGDVILVGDVYYVLLSFGSYKAKRIGQSLIPFEEEMKMFKSGEKVRATVTPFVTGIVVYSNNGITKIQGKKDVYYFLTKNVEREEVTTIEFPIGTEVRVKQNHSIAGAVEVVDPAYVGFYCNDAWVTYNPNEIELAEVEETESEAKKEETVDLGDVCEKIVVHLFERSVRHIDMITLLRKVTNLDLKDCKSFVDSIEARKNANTIQLEIDRIKKEIGPRKD